MSPQPSGTCVPEGPSVLTGRTGFARCSVEATPTGSAVFLIRPSGRGSIPCHPPVTGLRRLLWQGPHFHSRARHGRISPATEE